MGGAPRSSPGRSRLITRAGLPPTCAAHEGPQDTPQDTWGHAWFLWSKQQHAALCLAWRPPRPCQTSPASEPAASAAQACRQAACAKPGGLALVVHPARRCSPGKSTEPSPARPASPSHHGVWLDVLCNHCAARHGGALAHRHAWQDDAAACRGRVLCRERLALHVHARATLSRPARHARLSHGADLLAKPPGAGHAGKEPRPSLSGRKRQAEILDPGSAHLPARRRCRSMRSAQSRRAQAGAV